MTRSSSLSRPFLLALCGLLGLQSALASASEDPIVARARAIALQEYNAELARLESQQNQLEILKTQLAELRASQKPIGYIGLTVGVASMIGFEVYTHQFKNARLALAPYFTRVGVIVLADAVTAYKLYMTVEERRALEERVYQAEMKIWERKGQVELKRQKLL